jgi:hypothetical protein
MSVNDIVLIKTTEEIPTVHNGSKGTVWKEHYKHKGMYLVLVWSIQEAFWFHETQLVFLHTSMVG